MTTNVSKFLLLYFCSFLMVLWLRMLQITLQRSIVNSNKKSLHRLIYLYVFVTIRTALHLFRMLTFGPYNIWFFVFQHDDFRMGVHDISWVQCSDKVYVYIQFIYPTQKVYVITIYTHSSINHTERWSFFCPIKFECVFEWFYVDPV